MKNILVVVLAVSVLCGVSHHEHNYTRKDCKVIQVNDGYVTVEDKCGMSWDFKGNEFEVGDKVELKMYDSLTTSCATDDVVKGVVRK